MTLYKDDRGYLQSAFKKNTDDIYQSIEFVEDRFSYSKHGTLRGFHFDRKTWKFCACVHGEIQIVFYNIDKKTLVSKIMTPSSEGVLVPPNHLLAHLCISYECILYYKWSEYYENAGARHQMSVRYDDPTVNAPWLFEPTLLSERDEKAGNLECII